ncbi:hypothetical protein BCR15_00605 [Tessaracoccus lapidicaptus]|uniref:Uncharacterized protein n=1 Tax=Tessaracoccus lapidicaptus TaxID=1427523 RepID=A0A1C0AQ29_9ACTN|nr:MULTISPECIES: hypothetical protein [Tessaracoccus]OCL36407.1 hypothetical protein BCR15_00605 [Tessaracoccus lapidicaptus]VEP39544.1 hypothetical protein TLA_TLA_00925 [Tessaracoccus lapidicaptus]
MAESTTENLFREFYGASTFIEKRDIPKKFGFRSKRKGSTDDEVDAASRAQQVVAWQTLTPEALAFQHCLSAQGDGS